MKSPITLLAGVVLILGGIALGGFGALQWIRPTTFQAETKILVRKPSGGGYDALFMKTEAERIQSPAVLTNVMADLDLNEVWGKKYNNGQRLSDSQVEQILQIDAQPVRNAEVIGITVRSQDPAEAVALANAVTRSYRVHAEQSKVASASVIMPATAPARAVGPNRPIIIMFIASGIVMAFGGIVCLKESTTVSEA